MAASGSTTVVLVALGCNLAIATAKFTAYVWTGSSAMLSEAIHSLVDTSNQALLLYGIKQSKRPPDAKHPFGYSRELYFWSFIVAILLFSLGAGVAMYEGIEKLLHPHKIENAYINYIVLGIAMVLESFSTWKAVSEFNKRRGEQGIMAALRASKDPALFAIVLEDLAALAGLTIALCGVYAADQLGFAEADGVASILIGLVLAATAAFLSIEIKSLIVGEAASAPMRSGLRLLINAETGEKHTFRAINEIRTMQLGPEDVLVAASVDVHNTASAADIEAATARVERAVKARYPDVKNLFIEVQSAVEHGAIARNHIAGHSAEGRSIQGRSLNAAGTTLARDAKSATGSMKPSLAGTVASQQPATKSNAVQPTGSQRAAQEAARPITTQPAAQQPATLATKPAGAAGSPKLVLQARPMSRKARKKAKRDRT